MFSRIRRLLRQFFRRSSTLNNEPLNKVSLVVIVLVDIFILVNVFTGLDDISRWHISPAQEYPCYSSWQTYRSQANTKNTNRDFDILRQVLSESAAVSSAPLLPSSFSSPTATPQNYRDVENGHLGRVGETCLQYEAAEKNVNTAPNRQLLKSIDQKQNAIDKLKADNAKIRDQYGIALQEKIAGQLRERSINTTNAETAKATIDQNNAQIATLEKERSTLIQDLAQKPESAAFLQFLNNNDRFNTVEKGFRHASFWYPSLQLFFQALFLVPLLLVAAFVNSIAQRKRYGLVALISWHLLVIFSIPLIIKVFEFLQVGVLFSVLADFIQALFGGLLFLVSYLYILLIPVLGFGMIKFFQRFVFNPKVQAANRVQRSSCVRCARRIRQQDHYCPHCGYNQYTECSNCHTDTYEHLPYCHNCGHEHQH